MDFQFRIVTVLILIIDIIISSHNRTSTKYHFGILVGNGPNIDERLKAARERREEQMKLLGM